eukprot:4987162-Prymnesium_polylepis.1
MREVSCRSCRRVLGLAFPSACARAARRATRVPPGGGAPALVSHPPRARPRHTQPTPENPVCGRCACCRSLG